jgi:hypothetical protein
MYSFKTPMDPISLVEFNNLSSSAKKQKVGYEKDNLHTGSTLSHCPRIWETTDTVGNKIFRLIWVEN